METKICTYTEKSLRLQLVRIHEIGSSCDSIELRFNRKVISRFKPFQSTLARYRFSHVVHDLVVLRDSSVLSKLT